MKKNSLIISDQRIIRKLPLSEIILVKSKGMSCCLYSPAGVFHCSKNMGAVSRALASAGSFFRVHTSILINMNHVVRINRSAGTSVLLSNGFLVQVAKRRRSDFFAAYSAAVSPQ